MKTLKKNNISKGSSINSPVTVNKNCDLPPFFNTDYFSHVVVQTLEELESIPCKLRQDGMVATVVQEDYSDYQLQTSRTGFGICDNNAWVKISIGDEVFNGNNLFLFQTEEQANEFMGSTQSKEGQIIYISDLDSYFKFDGQDGLTDAFPNKLDKPTVQGLDNPNYKIPAYLDGKPYWRSSSDFGKVDTVNGIEPDGNKNVDLGIDDILPKGMPLEETLDDNKKVLLYDDRGKSYWKSLSEVGKVKSVNGKEGDVILKTSDLENNSDYTTNATLTVHASDKANPHNVTKSQIGLGNIDNTSDINKPISTATQIELNKKINKPTTNNTPDYVLLADGSTAPKLDFGKVDKVMGVAPDANKNVDISGVAMNWTNASQRFSRLVDKSADAIYNQLLGVDSNGYVAKVGLNAVTNAMVKSTDAQKDAFRIASRKSGETYSTGQPRVDTILPPVIDNTKDYIQYVTLVGLNLFVNNSNPSTASVSIIRYKDINNQLIPEETHIIDNYQVYQTNQSILSFGIDYSLFPTGYYKVKVVHNGFENIGTSDILVTTQVTTKPIVLDNWEVYTPYDASSLIVSPTSIKKTYTTNRGNILEQQVKHFIILEGDVIKGFRINFTYKLTPAGFELSNVIWRSAINFGLGYDKPVNVTIVPEILVSFFRGVITVGTKTLNIPIIGTPTIYDIDIVVKNGLATVIVNSKADGKILTNTFSFEQLNKKMYFYSTFIGSNADGAGQINGTVQELLFTNTYQTF